MHVATLIPVLYTIQRGLKNSIYIVFDATDSFGRETEMFMFFRFAGYNHSTLLFNSFNGEITILFTATSLAFTIFSFPNIILV